MFKSAFRLSALQAWLPPRVGAHRVARSNGSRGSRGETRGWNPLGCGCRGAARSRGEDRGRRVDGEGQTASSLRELVAKATELHDRLMEAVTESYRAARRMALYEQPSQRFPLLSAGVQDPPTTTSTLTESAAGQWQGEQALPTATASGTPPTVPPSAGDTAGNDWPPP
jgi:hypothetical protein